MSTMRHKSMKSLLLAAVALLGFALPARAIDVTLAFETATDADLSGQDIRLGTSAGNLQKVNVGADGVCDKAFTVSDEEISWTIYYSINGYKSSVDIFHWVSMSDLVTSTVTLRKLRFNYSGTNLSTFTIYATQTAVTRSAEGSIPITLDVNKDYYFPAGMRFQYVQDDETDRETLSEDTEIDLPDMNVLSVNVDASEAAKALLYLSLEYYDEYGYWSAIGRTELGVTTLNQPLPLSAGKYRVTLRSVPNPDNPSLSNTLDSREIDLTSDQTITFKACTVTVKVVEPDGTPVADFSVNTSDSRKDTDAQGQVTFVTAAAGKQFSIYSTAYWDDQLYDITADKTITLTIPKMMSFKLVVDGKPYEYEGQYNRPSLCDRNRDYSVSCEHTGNGNYRGRIDPNVEYYAIEEGYRTANFVKVTDGMTIRIGKFSTKADGVGLDCFSPDRRYYSGATGASVILGGTPVRIAAIPVGNEQFMCWDINGKEYTNPMIDFTPKEDVTVATAKFTGEIGNQVKGIAGQNAQEIRVTLEGGYLVLPDDVEAEAAIYAMDGRLTKKTGVVGNRIFISNLPDGAYVLVLTADGLRQTATFVKQ